MTAVVTATGISLEAAGRTILVPTDLALAAGELTVVIGPNGAGKSTLLRVLAGEIAPASGTVLYGGTPVAAMPPWRLAAKRAVLPQSAQLAFPFTVAEVVRLGLDGAGNAAERMDMMRRALAAADVAHLAGRNYQTLSGGEQQRVQFARVLGQLMVGGRREKHLALFLDEPVASLDLRHQLGLLEHARRLAGEGVAVLAILHDLNLAAAYGDRLVVMKAGAVFADGSPEKVLTDALLRDVFNVQLNVGAVPATPFVLPRPATGGAA